MDEAREIKLLNTIKTKIIGWIVGSLLTAIVGLTAFYFNTNYVTAQNSLDIKQIKSEVKKVTTVPVLNQNKIKNIEKDVSRIEKNQKDNHKEVKETQKEMRKELQKITELLYQIKSQKD